MKLSAKTKYAARILLCMAKQGNLVPVSSSWLSAKTEISAQFIEQILRQLRIAGITDSVRGARGGHILVQKPQDVTFGTILKAMEGGIELSNCLDCPDSCDRCRKCAMHNVWGELQQSLYNALEAITLDDVLRKSSPDMRC
ncbi:MAG: Rrf2 family transcriptional regulator [Desulfovibrio sp.]|nr:Rrf2 family transcriptional regulator [Desulfovibrio sp.]